MPVQIGAPTIAGGASTRTAEAISRWAAEKQHQQAQKNLRLAREEGEQVEILEDATGKKIMPEQKPVGFFGGKTAEEYNKGVRDAYVLSVDQDNTAEVNRIAQESDGNLDQFEEVISKYRSTVLGNVDPVVANDIRQSLDSMIVRGRNQVQRLGIDRQIKKDREARFMANQNYLDEAGRLTRNGDFEGAQENLLKSRAALDSMVASGDISGVKADEVFLQGKKEVFRQGHKKEVLDVAEDDLALAEQKLTALEKEIPNDFTPDEWESVVDDIRADVNRIRSKVAGKARASANQLKTRLKDYKESVSLGFKVDPNERTEIASGVAGTELQKEFNRINKIEQFSVLPADTRDRIVEQASGATTLDGQQDYAALKTANDQLKRMASEDGVSLGVRQGLIDPGPLNIDDPDSINQRVQAVEELSETYGVDVPFFQDTEAQALADGLEKATVPEKVSLAQRLGGIPNAWEQLASKEAQVFAMAGATGDADLMTQVFKGQELLATKLAQPIKAADYADDYAEMIEGIYGPEDAQAILKSALAHYAATSDHKDGSYSHGDFKNSVHAVTGGIGKINGFRVELPRGVEEDRFDDFIDDIQPQTVEALGGVMGVSSEKAVDLIRRGRIRNIKSGAYIVETDNGVLFTSEGKPFVIEWDEELVSANNALVRIGRSR